MIYQTLPWIGSQTGYLRAAANPTQAAFTVGMAGVHTVAAPFVLLNNRK